MARSIHTTRHDLKDAEMSDYADSEKRIERLTYLGEELSTKQRIKKSSKQDRAFSPPAATILSEIPIRVIDEGAFIHYSASPDDIREVIRRLPQGVLDGIESIELSLGAGSQMDRSGYDAAFSEPDPLTGRLGYELLPGVFTGGCLGTYYPDLARINIYAYVYDELVADHSLYQILLRLNMLGTFVHEVAHHYDKMMRVARGTWRSDVSAKNEVYAERREYDWLSTCVIPYLEEAYPAQVKAIMEWLKHFGGVEIPLMAFVPDPRWYTNGKLYAPINCVFSIWGALEGMINDVTNDVHPIRTRIGFATELHYAELYEPALEIVAGVRSQFPDDLEALILEGDIYIHQKRFDEAERLIRQAIGIDDKRLYTWELLADIHEARSEWQDLLKISNHILGNLEIDGRLDAMRALRQKALAGIHLRDYLGAERDILAIESFGGILSDRKSTELRRELAAHQSSHF